MLNELQVEADYYVHSKGAMPDPANLIGANLHMSTNHAVPLGDGQAYHDSHAKHAITKFSETGARQAVIAISDMPPGGEEQSVGGHQSSTALAATISELIALQRQRRFCIVSQSRCDRSVESFIAQLLGYNKDADAKERKAVFAKASAFRKEVEKGGGQSPGEDQATFALSPAIPLILLSANAREAWDKQRNQVEKRMRKLAQTLPGWSYASTIKGLGDKSYAILIGECGDWSNYATKERVWKRLGLAVIDGERQGRRSNGEEAAKHGYSPKRRSEAWNVADSLFKHQWRGAKEDAPAGPIGRYGEIYAARKAATVNREDWTPARRDNDARRVMTKALIEDLWKAWRKDLAASLPEVM